MGIALLNRYRLLKSITVFLVGAFSLQQVAFAAPGVKPFNLSFFQKSPVSFKLPESVAKLDDSYKAPHSDKTLILIRDAHTNESGQINLAKALDIILQEEEIRYVFSEAAMGDNSLSFLKQYGSPELRDRVGLSYLRKGILKGSEYLNMTSDHDFVIWGVEDKELYVESLKSYKLTFKERDEIQTYLKKINLTVKTLKSKLFGSELLEFDNKHEDLSKDEISLTDYFAVLLQEAKQAKISLSRFKNLKALKKITEKEKDIDFEKASLENQQFIVSEKGLVPEALELSKYLNYPDPCREDLNFSILNTGDD